MQVFKLNVLFVFFKVYLKLLVYFDFKLSTEHSIESIKLKKKSFLDFKDFGTQSKILYYNNTYYIFMEFIRLMI